MTIFVSGRILMTWVTSSEMMMMMMSTVETTSCRAQTKLLTSTHQLILHPLCQSLRVSALARRSIVTVVK